MYIYNVYIYNVYIYIYNVYIYIMYIYILRISVSSVSERYGSWNLSKPIQGPSQKCSSNHHICSLEDLQDSPPNWINMRIAYRSASQWECQWSSRSALKASLCVQFFGRVQRVSSIAQLLGNPDRWIGTIYLWLGGKDEHLSNGQNMSKPLLADD